MKILFACEIFPPDIGGPATYVEKIAPQIIKDNHQVVVVTYSDKDFLENDKNLNYKVFRIRRKKNLIFRYFLYFFILYKLSKKADLIFAQGPIPSGLPSILVKLLSGKKVVIKVVGDFIWERSRNVYGLAANVDDFQKQKHSLKIKCLRWLQKTILNRADQVIVPSLYLKKIVTGWGVREQKIKVVYNAVEQINCSLSKAEAKQKINCQGDIILSAGRLVPWKGFDFLIKTFPKILEINPNFKLVINGDGPELNKLKNLITELKLEGKVILTGQIEHRDMPIYYRAADIFILNTGYEGLSHILVETLMIEMLVIASDLGGNPEVIENNYNGLLIKYNDQTEIITAIRKLWQDKELQNKFRLNSKASLNKFQFENMYHQTLAVLTKVIAK